MEPSHPSSRNLLEPLCGQLRASGTSDGGLAAVAYPKMIPNINRLRPIREAPAGAAFANEQRKSKQEVVKGVQLLYKLLVRYGSRNALETEVL